MLQSGYSGHIQLCIYPDYLPANYADKSVVQYTAVLQRILSNTDSGGLVLGRRSQGIF